MGRGLSVIGFPNASSFRDRHGKLRFRYRAKGSPTIYLKGLPGSPEFAESYEAARNGRRAPIGSGRTKPGSLSALGGIDIHRIQIMAAAR